MLLSIVTILYVTSPEVPFNQLHSFPLFFSHPSKHQSILLPNFFFLSIHISGISEYLSYSVWHISLGTMPSSLIHILTNWRISFYFVFEKVFSCIYFPYFLYPFMHQYKLSCITQVISTTWLFLKMLQWIRRYRYLFDIVILPPLGIYPEVGLLDCIILFFIFEGTFILFCIMTLQIYIPNNLFPTSSPALVTSCIFGDSYSNRCKAISHRCFDLHFPCN